MALPKTREERTYAVERLREAGPYAVPALIQELGRPALPPDERTAIVDGLGSLDASAVPPLIATLEAPDPAVAASAAEALGAIGDRRAVPALTAVAARANPPARDSARRAIARITGAPFDSQRESPARILTDAARRAFLAAPREPEGTATDWDWDAAAKAPAPRETTRREAQSAEALKLARQALAVAPADRRAQATLLETALERDPNGAASEALAAGPVVLGDVARQAIADGRSVPAVAAVTALGQVTDRNALGDGTRPGALVEALDAPDRRVQFAAARALVGLDPRRPFPGSSRVVPTLARFVAAGPAARAVVIDGNADRASLVVGFLKGLGYDAQTAATGEQGFRMAADSADVELIAIDPDLVRGHWRLVDTLANLRADPQTAGIPTFIYGPLYLHDRLTPLLGSFPEVRLLVTPTRHGPVPGRGGPRSGRPPRAAALGRRAGLVREGSRGPAGEGREPARRAVRGRADPGRAGLALRPEQPRDRPRRGEGPRGNPPGRSPALAGRRTAQPRQPARPPPRRGRGAGAEPSPLRTAARRRAGGTACLDSRSDRRAHPPDGPLRRHRALKPKAASSGRRLQDFRPAPNPAATPAPATSPAAGPGG